MKPIYYFILAGLVLLIGYYFCDISQYFDLQFCQDVTTKISYDDDSIRVDTENAE